MCRAWCVSSLIIIHSSSAGVGSQFKFTNYLYHWREHFACHYFRSGWRVCHMYSIQHKRAAELASKNLRIQVRGFSWNKMVELVNFSYKVLFFFNQSLPFLTQHAISQRRKSPSYLETEQISRYFVLRRKENVFHHLSDICLKCTWHVLQWSAIADCWGCH